uniref:Uncharacterized protein n=1 Tax=Human herpesvirus 2 TaxID=10310 RepID=A0A481TVT6_HHV2|nr:hypothetical protein [Human alphaherpesvirus 2]QBH82970.1 hypothetical protein [Human alphaherpesvirus 2]QBH85192.1 hypothetical protein [Human alphaherpesvirus 2]QBH85350.1 hypothetical protein [Human alphaherpesvirus 2]
MRVSRPTGAAVSVGMLSRERELARSRRAARRAWDRLGAVQ